MAIGKISKGKLKKFDLSRQGIRELIKDIDGLKRDTKNELQDGATKYVASQAVELLQSELPGKIGQGVTMKVMDSRGGRTRVTIYNEFEDAIFWEYGTGANGENLSYNILTGEDVPIKWEYASGQTVEHDRASPRYGSWELPFGGRTYGQPAHAGWYHAKQKIEGNLAWWANEYIQEHL